ncbi:MAG: PHB depolymerase family esterase [Candidatus Velthaea sp.]
MKPISHADMAEATRLTRQGRLSEATTLIQQILSGTKSPHVTPESRANARLTTAEEVVCVPRRSPGPHGAFTAHAYRGAAGSRDYKLYVPSGYRGKPCPLIVMLHGCAQSVDDFAGGTGMNAVADENGCLVAYPIQSNAANQSKCWNWFNPRDQQRDGGEPALIVGIVQQIARDHAVDVRRVYVAGLSAGGAMAAVVGACYPDVFAAIGVHSGVACGAAHDPMSALAAMRGQGAQTGTVNARSDGRRDVPTIVFHGDRDGTVHPSNADRIVETMQASRLQSSVERSRIPGGRAYTREVYRDDRGRVLLERWTVQGADHAWSGGRKPHSFTDPAGPDASQAMMRFFLTHQREG